MLVRGPVVPQHQAPQCQGANLGQPPRTASRNLAHEEQGAHLASPAPQETPLSSSPHLKKLLGPYCQAKQYPLPPQPRGKRERLKVPGARSWPRARTHQAERARVRARPQVGCTDRLPALVSPDRQGAASAFTGERGALGRLRPPGHQAAQPAMQVQGPAAGEGGSRGEIFKGQAAPAPT